MKAIGIKRNGERMELEYSSEVELEFMRCRYQIVKMVEEEKSIKAPMNKQVKVKNLITR